ncbi:hypothetical protein MMC11_006547 [Xylographa trunciseda]|nr:hypothetical protein [Xylographa trunciseda]
MSDLEKAIGRGFGTGSHLRKKSAVVSQLRNAYRLMMANRSHYCLNKVFEPTMPEAEYMGLGRVFQNGLETPSIIQRRTSQLPERLITCNQVHENSE